MEILKNFGFEPVLFVGQIINFLILAYVFKRFLYKPILKILREREERIKKGLSDSEEAAKLLERTQKEGNEIIKRAARTAEQIIDEAKSVAENVREERLEKTKEEAGIILQNAKSDAKLEIKRVETQMKTIAVTLAQDILDKIIGEIFTQKDKDVILRRSIEKLRKYE